MKSKYTNINIASPMGPMTYYLEYFDNNDYVNDIIKVAPDFYDNRAHFYNAVTNIRRNCNEWYVDDINQAKLVGSKAYRIEQTPFISEFGWDISDDNDGWYNVSTIKLYFPRFSVYVYESNIKYAVNIITWVHGIEINLGSYLIDRNDAVAAENIKMLSNEEYYEYVPMQIIDPRHLIYSDRWKSFRRMVCGESDSTLHYNDAGASINISVHPVRKSGTMLHPESHKEVDVYTEIDDYKGGQNSINFGDNATDFINLNISTNLDENDGFKFISDENMHTVPEIDLIYNIDFTFNKEYVDAQGNQGVAEFKKYLRETYSLQDDYRYAMEIVLQDDENIFSYSMIELDKNNPWKPIRTAELLDPSYPNLQKCLLKFGGWDGFHDGMYLNFFFHVKPIEYDENGNLIPIDESDDILCVKSNSLIITQDIYKYMIEPIHTNRKYFYDKNDVLKYFNVKTPEGYNMAQDRDELTTQKTRPIPGVAIPKKILDNLNMNIYNINAVKKVQQEVIQIERPDNYKSNMIKPIFFQANPVSNITIHSNVIEFISINLDGYKSKVASFMISVGGIKFTEVSRNTAGIVFRIDGTALTGIESEGTYYVLNQDNEFVTSGQYTYE